MYAVMQNALPADLMVVVCASPGKTCLHTQLMLARIPAGGAFELLNAGAWADALGYPLGEISGTFLHELMPVERPTTSELVAALLGEAESPPLDVTLWCKDRRRKRFRFHRRRDPYDGATFVLADELLEERRELLACN